MPLLGIGLDEIVRYKGEEFSRKDLFYIAAYCGIDLDKMTYDYKSLIEAYKKEVGAFKENAFHYNPLRSYEGKDHYEQIRGFGD